MKFRMRVGWLVAVLVLMTASISHATVIDFEDLYTGSPKSGYLSDGYAGMSWSQLPHATWMTSDFVHQYGVYNTGLDNGITGHVGLVTLSTVRGGAPLLSFTASHPIDFISADITAFARIGLDVTVEGWLNGVLQYSQTVLTSYDQIYSFNFNFNHIDTVMFKPGIEGTSPYYNWTRRQVIIDNIAYVYNPEPSSVILLGSGLIGFGLWWRKNKG